MRNFWTHISNERYSIGCTGQTVYLYDKDGNYFINIERQQDELLSAISFYNTSDFPWQNAYQ